MTGKVHPGYGLMGDASPGLGNLNLPLPRDRSNAFASRGVDSLTVKREPEDERRARMAEAGFKPYPGSLVKVCGLFEPRCPCVGGPCPEFLADVERVQQRAGLRAAVRQAAAPFYEKAAAALAMDVPELLEFHRIFREADPTDDSGARAGGHGGSEATPPRRRDPHEREAGRPGRRPRRGACTKGRARLPAGRA